MLALSSASDFSHLRARAPRRRAGVRPQALRARRPEARIAGLLNGGKRRRQRAAQARRPARRQRPRQPASSWTTRWSRQNEAGGRLGDLLVAQGLVTEQDIITAVAGQMHIGVVDLTQVAPQPAALGLLPRDFIVRRRLMPISIEESGSLVLAMTNPLDVISIDEVGMRTKRRVVPVICRRRASTRPSPSTSARAASSRTRATRARRAMRAPAPSTPTSSRSSTPCSPTPPPCTRRTSTSSRPRRCCGSATASTAGCTSPGECRQHLLNAVHQPHQDHGLAGHQRAAAAPGRPRPRDCSRAARSTCASAPSPPPTARRPSSACSTPAASR